MVFTKKTLSSQNSSDTRFSLYNHTLFLTQIKYSHDAEEKYKQDSTNIF